MLYNYTNDGQGYTVEQKLIILETIQRQALQNFKIGLQNEIKILVRSQRYTTLEEAIDEASAEEKVNYPLACTSRVNNNYANRTTSDYS